MCAQAQSSQKLSTTKSNDYGLTYRLPVTVVDVVFEVKHTTQTPGEFKDYATSLLGLDGVIIDPYRESTLESVTLVPRSQAAGGDPVLAKFKPGVPVEMTLSADGMPLAINANTSFIYPTVILPQAKPATKTALDGNAAQQAMTQEMMSTSLLSRRAQLSAQRIYELRETRNEYLSGTADNMPPDGRALELVLAGLEAQEAALTAMFTGTTSEQTTIHTVTYIMPDSLAGNEIIARISPTDGFLAKDNLAGEPIYLTITDIKRPEQPLDDKGQPRPAPKSGVQYNIPGSATITITNQGKDLARLNMPFSQLGFTYALDPTQFTDKKNPAYVEFSPLTGGIIRMGTLKPAQ